MDAASVQFGFDIATSLSIIGASGIFLWERFNNKKEMKQEFLLSSLDSLKQNCVKFTSETQKVHRELDVFIERIKDNAEANDPEIVNDFKRRVVYSAWEFKNEIRVLTVSDFSVALNENEMLIINDLMKELDSAIEWWVFFFEGQTDAPELLKGKYKTVWRAFDDIPLKIVSSIVSSYLHTK